MIYIHRASFLCSFTSLFALCLFLSASVQKLEACPPDLRAAALAIAKKQPAATDERAQDPELPVGSNKKGPYIVHVSGKQLPFMVVEDATLGTAIFRPSIPHVLSSVGLDGAPRDILPSRFNPQSAEAGSEVLEATRVPSDSAVVILSTHGGGTKKSTGLTSLMLMDIFSADHTDTSGDLKPQLHLDAFRLFYAMEAPNLPGSRFGPDQSNFTLDWFMEWLHRYVMEIKRTGKKVIPQSRSASTGYWLEFHRRYPDVLDGLILMSPMHPEIGYQEGMDALYEKYQDSPEVLSPESIEFVQRMYEGMDWSNLKAEIGDLPVLVLIGGQDNQVPAGVTEFYQDLLSGSSASRVLVIEEGGHDLYSFQEPEWSIQAYLATQDFIFSVLHPDLHIRWQESRDQIMRNWHEEVARVDALRLEVEAAKSRAKAVSQDLQDLSPSLGRIEDEMFLRFQLEVLQSSSVSVPDRALELVGSYRDRTEAERAELQHVLQEAVNQYTSQGGSFPSKKSFRLALEAKQIEIQIEKLQAQDVEVGTDLLADLANYKSLGNKRAELQGRVQRLMTDHGLETPSLAEVEALLEAEGVRVIGFAQDPEFMAIEARLLELEQQRRALNTLEVPELSSELKYREKALKEMRKAIIALRLEIQNFISGATNTEPGFQAVIDWDVNQVMQMIKDREERERELREQQRASRKPHERGE